MNFQDFQTDEEVINYFKNLPEEGTIEFSTKIIEFVANVRSDMNMIHRLKQLFLENKENEDLSFSLFYGWTKLLIRYECYTDFVKAMQEYGEMFSNRRLYNVLQSTYYMHYPDEDSELLAIECAWNAVLQLNGHRGVHIQFVETVLVALEKGIIVDNKHVERARESVRKAIQMSPSYAKYYFFRGRLFAQDGQFEKAKKQIKKAIDLEVSGKADYSVKLTNYKYYLMYVENLATTESFKSEVRLLQDTSRKNLMQLDEQVKADRVKNIQILGFFAAIISLIIASVQIAAKMTFLNAGG